MVLTKFPDLEWLKHQAENSFENRQSWSGKPLPNKGWPNVILNVSTNHTFRDNIRGPLSIFTNIAGESTVTADRRRISIKENFFFVTNRDQYYTLEIDQRKPTQTFNVHFGEYFTDQVFSSLSLKEDQLLEEPFQFPQERLEFHNTLYYRDNVVNGYILEIKDQPNADPCWLEEKLYDLMGHLLKKEKDLLKIQAKLPALKSSTRCEILKRLLQVTDYIHAHLHEDLSLDQLASVGCLSKFHFLRLFKIAFGRTPYQFISEERIRNGKELIKNTRLEIHEIAKSLGFDNSSSFSRMFFNHVGVYPTQLRQALP